MTTVPPSRQFHLFQYLQCLLFIGAQIIQTTVSFTIHQAENRRNVRSWSQRVDRRASVHPKEPSFFPSGPLSPHNGFATTCLRTAFYGMLPEQEGHEEWPEHFLIQPEKFDEDEGWEWKAQQTRFLQLVLKASSVKQVADTIALAHSREIFSFPIAATALRKIATQKDYTSDDMIRKLEHQLLVAIQSHLFNPTLNDMDQEYQPLYSQRALSDTLISLSILKKNQLRSTEPRATVEEAMGSPTNTSSIRLAERIWSLLFEVDHDAPQLCVKRLADCLMAIDTLAMPVHSVHRTMTIDRIRLRLSQGDSLASLSSIVLVRLMRLVLKRLRRNRGATNLSCLRRLCQALARRLRKHQVHKQLTPRVLLELVEEASNYIVSCQDFKNYPAARPRNQNMNLNEELRTMVYTLIWRQILRHDSLSPLQYASLLRIARTLCLSWEDDVVQETVKRVELYLIPLMQASNIPPNGSTNFWDLATAYMEAQSHWKQSDTTSDAALRLGEHLDAELRGDRKFLRPWHIHSLLRSAVLLHRHNSTVMEPYISSLQELINCKESFMLSCNVSELSNLCWILLRARVTGDDARKCTLSLSRYLLSVETSNRCTPKIASRILSSLSELFSLHFGAGKAHEVAIATSTTLPQLFDVYGPHLLSCAALSTADLSSSVYAFGRVSFARDMGIFDNLLEELAGRLNRDMTVRQAAQTLWACGKMVVWEERSFETMEILEVPPYMSHFLAICGFLVYKQGELTSKDVSQALWALARFHVPDDGLIGPLSHRSKQLASTMSMHEIASVLWALSNLGKRRQDVVELVFHLTPEKITMDRPNPHECSSILYSLASLKIRDDKLYKKFTDCLLAQVDDADAQDVTTVLWAHDAVHIRPPQRLLDEYALVKLGMVPAYRNGTKLDAQFH